MPAALRSLGPACGWLVLRRYDIIFGTKWVPFELPRVVPYCFSVHMRFEILEHLIESLQFYASLSYFTDASALLKAEAVGLQYIREKWGIGS